MSKAYMVMIIIRRASKRTKVLRPIWMESGESNQRILCVSDGFFGGDYGGYQRVPLKAGRVLKRGRRGTEQNRSRGLRWPDGLARGKSAAKGRRERVDRGEREPNQEKWHSMDKNAPKYKVFLNINPTSVNRNFFI
jgi:hypothetical protein